MYMRDWTEIEARFRRLAEPLQHMRLDVQWGATGKNWRLTGIKRIPEKNKFDILTTIAGHHLDLVLPKQGEVYKKIKMESSETHKWYRAIKELTNDFEFGLRGIQTDIDENTTANIYTGTIPHPALSSANLCRYLHENYPFKDDSPIEKPLYGSYGKILGRFVGSLLKNERIKT